MTTCQEYHAPKRTQDVVVERTLKNVHRPTSGRLQHVDLNGQGGHALSDTSPWAAHSQTVRHLGVLVADIVDSTSMTERHGAIRMANMLVEFSDVVSTVIMRNHGTIHQFRGDSVMAIFDNAPDVRDRATNALQCSLQLDDALQAWRRDRLDRNAFPVRAGIGVHFGPVLRIRLAADDDRSTELVGNTVNMTARLEGLTRQLATSIAVSDDLLKTASARLDRPPLLELFSLHGSVFLKGRHRPMMVWSRNQVARRAKLSTNL